MSSLISKDRVSVCLFTFSDGRHCRTPRSSRHPHFCFYHARKESQARAAENLGEDLSIFFSRDFVTACDLSTALASLLPAVACGDIKPKTATTLAYLAQIFLQTLHLSQKEFIAAVGELEWRKTICDHINQNFNRVKSPPDAPEDPQIASEPSRPQLSSHAPAPQPLPTPAPSASIQACHPEHSKGSCPAPAPPTPDETSASSTQTPSAEPAANPGTEPSQPEAEVPQSARVSAALAIARSRFHRRSTNATTNPFNTNIYTTPRN